MTYDVEHLFICLFSICVSLMRYLLRSSTHFLIRLFCLKEVQILIMIIMESYLLLILKTAWWVRWEGKTVFLREKTTDQLYGQSFFLSKQRPGFPGGSDCKEFTYNAGDLGSFPGLGRSPERGNGYLFQCSCLEKSMGTEQPGRPQSMGLQKLDMTERLNWTDYEVIGT